MAMPTLFITEIMDFMHNLKNLLFYILLIGAILNFLQLINKKLYHPYNTWNVSIFDVSSDDIINYNYDTPLKCFSDKHIIRTKYNYSCGYADPFLITKDDELYCFYENIIYDGSGIIRGKKTKDLKNWEELDIVLQEPFHLSYPYTFKYNGDYYMIPETGNENAVYVYKALNFPYNWTRIDTLLQGYKFLDNSLIEKDDSWYLFTTIRTKDGKDHFACYESDCIFGEYLPCCENIKSDSLYIRNGGNVFEYNGKYYRPAQYSKDYYGQYLGMLRIDSLSLDTYKESFIKDIQNKENDWCSKGGHHFNMVEYNNHTIVAMDGFQKDNWINNRTRQFFKKK